MVILRGCASWNLRTPTPLDDMKLLEKRPGEILFLAFIIGGLVLTVAVATAERFSPLAGHVPGRDFDSGLIDGVTNGSSWDASVHGK